MQVRVLGPLAVSDGDTLITPSAPKIRRILALLAVRANSVVSVAQFTEELWEGCPPPTATATLQTYIHHLRRVVGPAGDEEGGLRTAFGGYQWSLPADALDATRFERLVDQGRANLADGRPDQAAHALDQALRLWRGPVLADLQQGPVLQRAAARLSEIRKGALEQRIELDLRLGRHHQLVGELLEIVSSYPADEGFHAQLILSLYRSGRRAEALHTYHRLRTVLHRELGVEPSAELRQLHRAVLDADPRLDRDTEGQPARQNGPEWTDRPPNLLPPAVPVLVGRRPALAAVRSALLSGGSTVSPVVAVVGPPGAGKSAFCVHTAWLSRDGYPDGQLYHHLVDDQGAPIDPAVVPGEFLRALGVPANRVPTSAIERGRLFRRCCAEQRILVVLEDAVGMDQVWPLLPAGPGCATVVSCRRRLADPAIAATVDLGPLGAAESTELLAAVLGPARVAADRDGVQRLVTAGAGAPLALRVLADRLLLRPHWPVGRAVRGEFGDRLWPSVARTYHRLSGLARQLFDTLAGTEAGPVCGARAAALLGRSEESAEAALEELVEYQLASVTGTQHGFGYRLYPLCQAAAAGRPTGPRALVPTG